MFLSYISNMSENLDLKGAKFLINDHDLIYIDIWGVVHNGVELYEDAVNVLDQLFELNKEYVLLTNAPRPNQTVKKFLRKMGLNKNHRDKVYTSGEAALKYLEKNLGNLKFFHIGPPKDFDLFLSFKNNKTEDIKKCDFLLCTGLFEEYVDNLNYYKKLFTNNKKLKMICTNPDLVVDKGNKREFCAGSIAKIYEEEGGEVNYFGKPYPLVYNLAANLDNKKILCIGDNLNTDIKGANMQNFKSLFITGGVHKNENLNEIYKVYNVKVDYTQTLLKW